MFNVTTRTGKRGCKINGVTALFDMVVNDGALLFQQVYISNQLSYPTIIESTVTQKYCYSAFAQGSCHCISNSTPNCSLSPVTQLTCVPYPRIWSALLSFVSCVSL